MLAHRQGAAWRQATATVAVAAAVAGATWYCAVRPYDRDSLAIQVAQLRSQAAEAGLAARLLREDAITPAFARFHARQLARKVEAVGGELRSHPGGGLDDAQQAAEAAAGALALRLRREPPSRARPGDAVHVQLSARMDALHERLEPAG